MHSHERLLVTSADGVMCLSYSVCLSVCLSVCVYVQNISKRLRVDFDQLLWRGEGWPSKESIRFCWQSRSQLKFRVPESDHVEDRGIFIFKRFFIYSSILCNVHKVYTASQKVDTVL